MTSFYIPYRKKSMRKEIYYNPKMELLPREELRALQEARFQKTLAYVWENQKPYRAKMEEIGVSPKDISSLADITKLPFTDKKLFQESYPCGMLAAPIEDVVRMHGSSGTTGNPAVVLCTQRDVDLCTEGFARAYAMQGCTKNSVIQNAASYSLFIGGLGGQLAAEKIGALSIPLSVGNTERQIKFLLDFKVENLTATPSYIAHIADVAQEMGYKKEDFHLKSYLTGGERTTKYQRERIERVLGGQIHDVYGFAEMTTVFSMCQYETGLHIPEDFIYVEIIDEAGNPLPDGEYGEIVVTTLAKTGEPIIRYRTHDIARIQKGECPCGRTSRRISPILRRTDDMIVFKGTKLSPLQIERVIDEFPALTDRYCILLTEGNFRLEVEEARGRNLDVAAFERALKEETGLRIEVFAGIPPEHQPLSGKRMQLLDKRAK